MRRCMFYGEEKTEGMCKGERERGRAGLADIFISS